MFLSQQLFSVRYNAPFYYTLNFEENKFYKRGHYLGLLYHYSKKYQMGVTYEERKERWTESKEISEKKPQLDYDVEDTINVLGFEFIIQL